MIKIRPIIYKAETPDPLFPDMTYLQAGYIPSGYYSTLYWWVPRTTRMLNGERPFFCFAKWGGSSTTQIIAVKSYSGDNTTFNFSGVLKYQQPSNNYRTGFGNSNSSNYLSIRQSMINFTGTLGYTVLSGGVQSFTSNPFNGDWTRGDEAHLYNMEIESDDLGYIIGNEYNQLSSVRTCDCDLHAYYFQTKPSEFSNKRIGDTISVSNWSGTDAGGNMLHSSQSNFGWWWEV